MSPAVAFLNYKRSGNTYPDFLRIFFIFYLLIKLTEQRSCCDGRGGRAAPHLRVTEIKQTGSEITYVLFLT
jgi:hypothetical protein